MILKISTIEQESKFRNHKQKPRAKSQNQKQIQPLIPPDSNHHNWRSPKRKSPRYIQLKNLTTQKATHHHKFSSATNSQNPNKNTKDKVQPLNWATKTQNFKNQKQKRTQIYNNPSHKSKKSIKKKKKKKTQNLKRAPDQIEQTALSTFGTVGYERRWQWATIAWEWVSEWVSLRGRSETVRV